MHKNILICLLLLTVLVQIWAIGQLAPDEPHEQCVPLYNQSGLECCEQ
jgi:hypothetical protein